MTKQLHLLLTAILLMVGICGNAQDVTVTINKNNGTFYKNGTQTGQNWNNKWVSNSTSPQVTLTAPYNNMNAPDNSTVTIASGSALSCTYTLSVSAGYRIKNYTITSTANNGDQTITPSGGTGTVFKTGVSQTLSVDVNSLSTTFVQTGSNTGLTGTITVTVTPNASTLPDATHRYRITNTTNRGSLYYDPTSSAQWVWSTGKSNSNTAAANYEWAFVPTGTTGEYYIYNIGRQSYIAPTSAGTFFDYVGGMTWVFTTDKVPVTVTDLGDGTYSLKTTSGTYLSLSNSYTGPVISYYEAGDGGVPFVFESQGDFDPATIPTTSGGLVTSDVSVKQAYQTTGLGNVTPLLRIDVVGSTSSVTLNQLSATLKGQTATLVNSVAVYTTTGEEFYAETPVKVGELATTGSADVAIPLNCTLQSGVNHLWLTATVKADAVVGNTIDAVATALTNTYAGTTSTLDIAAAGDPAGEAKIFKVHSFPFVPTTYNCRYYRIPAMIVANDGSLIAASDKRYNSNADLGNHKIDVVVRRSTDDGRTWGDPIVIAAGDGTSSAAYGYGDVALAKAPNGDIIAVMAAGQNNYWDGITHIGICISKDNGLTWSAVRDMTLSGFTDEIGNTVNSFAEFSNFISSGRGITTKDGVVMFLGNVLYNNDHSTVHNHVFSSADNGVTWTLRRESVYDGGDEAKLAQRADGAIMASIRQSGARGFNVGNSAGRKWATQYRSTELSGNACNADVIAYNDRLMLHTIIYNTSSRKDLRLYASTNNGENWHEVYNIQPGDAAYSSMEKLPNGDLGIIFEDASYGSNGYITTYVTLPKETVEAFADNNWNDPVTTWSDRVVNEYGNLFASDKNVYYSLTDASREALQPTYDALSQDCAPDAYFDFVSSVKDALSTGVKVPETGYYRIKSTKARGLYTYMAYGVEPQQNRTGLITVPATTGNDNLTTVFKLTRLDNGNYTLSTQGINVQGKPAADALFQLSSTDGQEFTINVVQGKPGVVGITTGVDGGYLNETNLRTDGYNGVTCWYINDPASQWTIEDADYVNVPLTTIGAKAYATIDVPFPFEAENAEAAVVSANAADNLANYEVLTDTVPSATPCLLVGDASVAVAKLNVRNTEPAPLTIANSLVGMFLSTTLSETPYLLGDKAGDAGFWNTSAATAIAANSAWIPAATAPANGEGFSLAAKPTSVALPHATVHGADQVFDLQGRKLQAPVRGVNIINGKKVVKR